MLDAKARQALSGIERTVGKGIARLGISANAVTAAGLVLTGVAAWLVLEGELLTAGLVLAVSGILDFLDGAVARAQGKTSPFGGVVDAVADRVSDGLILGALLWILFEQGRHVGAALALAALVLAQITSYIRAKAESLGYSCRIGIVERKERVVLLVAGLVFGLLEPFLAALAILSAVTVVQRLVHVGKQARGS